MPKFNADLMLEHALEKHGNILGILVAETAILANPAVHHRLLQQIGNAVKFQHVRRAHGKGEKRGQRLLMAYGLMTTLTPITPSNGR